ncbi:hypothetical protein HYX10_02760 [Candidatus Woesearchaeota archaeon]|nr:hypothetical protein [Candidatus Woesearchaeota archaeon]
MVKDRFREYGRTALGWLGRNKGKVFLAFLAVLLLAVFADLIVPAITIGIMGLAAIFSTFYKRIIRIPPAVELMTFTTILVSLLYGPIVAVIYTTIVSVASEIVSNQLDVWILTFVPGRIVMSFAAGFFFSAFGGSMLPTGVACLLLYLAITQPPYLLMADVQMRLKAVYFAVVNFCGNFIIFWLFGNLAAGLLGLV